jgi:hypothetical protein
MTGPGQTELIDVRRDRHDDVLERVERALDLTVDRSSVVHGAYGTTEGFRSSRDTWVRIQRRSARRPAGQAWIGAEAAAVLTDVPRPAWFQALTWVDEGRGVVWRADEIEFIASPAIQGAGPLPAEPALPEEWWAKLRTSLAALGRFETDRVGLRQAHLARRINQVFDGQVDTTVDEWVTAHADLHWRNLTVDGHLLDWEDWGQAPRGWDATQLWGASLAFPALAGRVQREFADDLGTRSGRLAQLLYCANVIRIASARGTEPPALEPATLRAEELLTELR